MLKIRLQRVGRKNIATFRVVLTESQNSTKSGRYKEVLGSYDPVHKVKEVDVERVKYWISKGAQPSDTLHNFFVDKKIVSGKKLNVLPAKKSIPKKKDAKAAGEKKEPAKEVPKQAEAAAPEQKPES